MMLVQTVLIPILRPIDTDKSGGLDMIIFGV